MRIGTVVVDDVERLVVAGAGQTAHLVDASTATRVVDVISWSAERRHELAAQAEASPAISTEHLRWLPPVPSPGKVVCVALNNSANASRIMSGPSHPATFIKPASALIGHNEPIRLRAEYGRVHPEPELAVVIGSLAQRVDVTHALDYVFGYTIMNDLTSPTMRGEDTFHYRAIHPGEDARDIRYVDSWVSYSGRYKGADTFGPMGPWIATPDEFPDAHDLAITCSHNGRIVTSDSTANLTNKTADVIAFVSSYQTLFPGDIVSLGTALQADTEQGGAVQNVDLTQLGGRIEVGIAGIGTLSNPVELVR